MKVQTEEILKFLQINSNQSYVDLAKQFGVTEAAIRKRIKKLTDEDYFSYTININYRKLGFFINAFIGFDAKPEFYHSLIDKMQSCEKEFDMIINAIYQTSIDHDFMIDCAFKSNSDLTQFLKLLEDTEGIIKICPAIINQKIR